MVLSAGRIRLIATEEALVAHEDQIYNGDIVERFWARLKEWRGVATRYEKTASSLISILCLAVALDWLTYYRT